MAMPIAPHQILCCQCAVPIEPNAINMCVNCLNSNYDIGAGVAKQVQQNHCRGCGRYERRDGGWSAVEEESKELLALLLRKPRGLAMVKLADASFVWTEPHSRRLKLKLTIQKEVVPGAVLQQTFVVEFILGNKQCPNCQRREAKDTWTAIVQMRQKVPHKRTFLWLEQLILKHCAHSDSTNIIELKDGLDFFFDQRSHAEKLVSFLQSVSPMRYKHSKQLVSEDTHTGKGKNKFTYSVEVLPICKDDLLWLPRQTSVNLGHISPLCICCKISNVIHVVDPHTLQAGELQPKDYFARPFRAALSKKDLVEFVVLDVDVQRPARGQHERRGNGTAPKRSHFNGRDAWCLAEVTVAKRSDFGKNDTQVATRCHLGNVLKVGDYVWGYCVAAAASSMELEPHEAQRLPEVLLVKKSYSDRHHRNRRRVWKLGHLTKESEPGVMRGRHLHTADHDLEMEEFMQELEEDPQLRSQINLYKDTEALERIAARNQKGAHSSNIGDGMAVEEDEDDDDFPDVELNELLDELTIGGAEEEEDEGAGDGTGGSAAATVAPVTFAPPDAMLKPGINPHASVEQFVLPGSTPGATPKFHF
mmetsp:Transcript_38426/g.95583  ORF Transcript_38426/g.95583 Transcript_38426/m.95583 type:complete len:588 (+) Transcript_38426:183-1946(+)